MDFSSVKYGLLSTLELIETGFGRWAGPSKEPASAWAVLRQAGPAAVSNAAFQYSAAGSRPSRAGPFSRDLPDLEEPIFASERFQIWLCE